MMDENKELIKKIVNDAKYAESVFVGTNPILTTLYQYYKGSQPIWFSTERLKDVFQSLKANFKINICAVVVESVLDRLSLNGWSSKKVSSTDLSDMFSNNNLDLLSQEIHESALVMTKSYVVLDIDEDGVPVMFQNDPRICRLFYSQENNRKKTMGVKRWIDPQTNQKRMNIYHDDFIYRLSAKPDSDNYSPVAGDWYRTNIFGEIPIVEFRNSLGDSDSQIEDILTLQDAVNKLFSDLLVTSEFQAFKQRYVITNADVDNLRNAPNEIWKIPAGFAGDQGSQVGELNGADLIPFFSAIDRIIYYASVLTRTPKHHLSESGSAPSGESLLIMEAPLVKKVKRIQSLYTLAWQDVARLGMKVKSQALKKSDIECIWGPVEADLPQTDADVIKKNVDAKIPLKTAVRRRGWSESEIKQMEADRKDESKQNNGPNVAAAVIAQIRQEQDAIAQNGSFQKTEPVIPDKTSAEDGSGRGDTE